MVECPARGRQRQQRDHDLLTEEEKKNRKQSVQRQMPKLCNTVVNIIHSFHIDPPPETPIMHLIVPLIIKGKWVIV